MHMTPEAFGAMRIGTYWEAWWAYTEEKNADRRHVGELARGIAIRLFNIQLDKITEDRILRRFPDKETSLYIIGSYNFRPEKAVKAFKKLGYKNAIFGGNMEEHYGMLKK